MKTEMMRIKDKINMSKLVSNMSQPISDQIEQIINVTKDKQNQLTIMQEECKKLRA
jgi:hypothetical protein